MLCLAGEQPLANAIPVRQMGADRLYILHTDDEARSLRPAKALQLWWREQGGQAELCPVGDGYDYAATLEGVGKASAGLDSKVIANVTGGTKPMSFALLSQAAERGWPAVYVDTQHRRLWTITDRSSAPLTARFGLDELLGLHGCQLDSDVALTRPMLDTARVVADNRTAVEPLRQAVSALREGSLWRPPAIDAELEAALRRAGGIEGPSGAYEPTDDGWEVLRKHGWLEALAAAGLRDAGADEVVLSGHRRGVEDEYDAMATFGPRLVLVECKAGGKIEEDAIKSLRQDAVRLGGLLAVPILVWCPPPTSLPNRRRLATNRERARDHRVHLVESCEPSKIAAAVQAALQ